MSETRVLIRLFRIYFPRILESGSASEFFWGGGVKVWTPQTPSERHWRKEIFGVERPLHRNGYEQAYLIFGLSILFKPLIWLSYLSKFAHDMHNAINNSKVLT
jgi:hypothetical protein